MILKSKRKSCDCSKKCNCKTKSTPTTKGGRLNNYDDDPTFNYDPDAPTFDPDAPTFSGLTLEENFENFGEAVVETAENFLPVFAGLVGRKVVKDYKKSAVGQARQQNKLERIQARQERRLSRIQGGQAVTEAKQRAKVEGSLSTIRNLNAPMEALQQAQQVNQLQSQVQPDARAVAPSQVPQAGETSGPLYQTLPMGGEAPAPFPTGLTGMGAGSMDTLPTEETPELTKKIEAVAEAVKTPEAPKKKSNVLFIAVALAVVIGAVYFLRKKKIA